MIQNTYTYSYTIRFKKHTSKSIQNQPIEIQKKHQKSPKITKIHKISNSWCRYVFSHRIKKSKKSIEKSTQNQKSKKSKKTQLPMQNKKKPNSPPEDENFNKKLRPAPISATPTPKNTKIDEFDTFWHNLTQFRTISTKASHRLVLQNSC